MPDVVELMPAAVQAEFNVVRVGRKYCTTAFVRLVYDQYQLTGKLKAAVETLQSQHIGGTYLETKRRYYYINGKVKTRMRFDAPPPQFPAYKDPEWGGINITYPLVRGAYTGEAKRRQPYHDRRMQMLEPGPLIAADQSYKVVKIIRASGSQVFDSLFLVFNQKGEAVGYQLTEDQAHSSYAPVLRGLHRRTELYNFDAVKVVYVDSCCRDRDLYTSVFPMVTDPRGLVEGK